MRSAHPAGAIAAGRDSDVSHLGTLVAFSIVFHIFVFFIVPLMAHLFSRSQQFERPKTFQLVSLPSPAKPSRARPMAQTAPRKPVARKKAAQPVPAAHKQPAQPKPNPQEVQEDLSELAELLGSLATPTQVTSLTSDFTYPWYLRTVESKIRSFWRPPYENDKIFVTVQFEISLSGDVTGLRVQKSSSDPALDNLALRAVTLASPFGKLPPRYAAGSFSVSCKLVPTRK